MTALAVVLGLLGLGVALYAVRRWGEKPRRRVALGVIGLAAIGLVVLVIQAATASCDADEAVSLPLSFGTWALLTVGGILSGPLGARTLNPLRLGLVSLALCAGAALLVYMAVDFAYKANCSPY
jgi:drug/metabolite transporter (DMT)-like permease